VEAWLAAHPEAAAEVEAQRRLAELCRTATPPEPGEAAWAALGERIAAGVGTARGRPGRRFAWIALVGSLAAGLFLAWLALGPVPRGPAPEPAPVAVVEPYPVVSPEDVEIISIAAADRDALVVGEPPLREPLVLVAPGEVEVQSIGPEADGMVPYVPAGPVAPTPVPNPRSAPPDRLP
jgi:hypothetical protein